MVSYYSKYEVFFLLPSFDMRALLAATEWKLQRLLLSVNFLSLPCNWLKKGK